MGRRRLNRFKLARPSAQAMARYVQHYPGRQLVHTPHELAEITSAKFFHNDHPLRLDLGCGRAEFLVAQAKANPGINYVGIDYHVKSLEDAVGAVETDGIENARFVRCDIRFVLVKCPDRSAERIYLLFPPPVRQRKFESKDIFTLSLLQHVHRILAPSGILEFATDHQSYFEEKNELVSHTGLFDVVQRTDGFEGGVTWYQRIWESHELRTYRVEFLRREQPVSRSREALASSSHARTT